MTSSQQNLGSNERRIRANSNSFCQCGVGEEKNTFWIHFKTFWLTHFSPMPHFYTPWKRQKTYGFLTFSGGIEMWHWTKIG